MSVRTEDASEPEEGRSLVTPEADVTSDDELIEAGMDKENLDEVKKLGFERNVNLSSSAVDEINPNFTRAIKTSLRVGVWTFVSGVGIWILRHSELLPAPYIVGLQGLVVAIIFNVTPKLAATIRACLQALFGTLLAIAIASVIYNLPDPHDDSLTPPDPAPTCATDPSKFAQFLCEDKAMMTASNFMPCLSSAIAFAAYAISVPLILGLNAVLPCKVFALVNLTSFLMNFASPYTSIEGYFELDWESTIVVTLVCQLIGSLVGTLAMCVPPILASHNAKTLAARVTKSTVKLLVTVNDYYTGRDATLEINVWNSELARSKEDLDLEKTDLEDAWWEHFNWGRWGRIQTLMLSHLAMLKDLARRMTVLQYSVLNEDFDETHTELMKNMREPLKQLVTCIGNLLLVYTIAASDGDVDEAEKDKLIKDQQTLKDAMLKVGKEWQEARRDNELKPELQQENFYICELCTMGRMMLDFGEQLSGEKSTRHQENIGIQALKDMFSLKNYKDKSYRRFILRTYIALMIAWCWACTLRRFSPGVPTNVIYMMSVVPGNALIQNLSKLQASVLGSLGGFTMYRFFHHCDPFHKIMKLSGLFFSIFFSMFISNYSLEFEKVGMLLAVYTGSKLIQPCQEELTQLDLMTMQTAEFVSMKEFVFSMLILTLVDFLLKEEPAYKKANDKLFEALNLVSSFLSSWVNSTMDEDYKDIIDASKDYKREIWNLTADITGKVEALLDEAADLAQGANDEPRFTKGPFKCELFLEIVKRVQSLQLNIQVLIRRSKASVDDQLLPLYISKCDSWPNVKQDLINGLDNMNLIVQEVLLHEKFGAIKYKKRGHERFRALLKQRDISKLGDLAKLNEEIKGVLPPSDDDDAANMENDEYCRVSVVFAMLNKLMNDMSDLCHLTVKNM